VAGETNYDQAFLIGMQNIDEHDHTGAPTKGKPITSAALADFSVQYRHLNTNVADSSTGIQAGAGINKNQLQIIGLLQSIFTLVPATGFITKTGAGTADAVTLTMGKANQVKITNVAGVGNPVFEFQDTVLNVTQPSFLAAHTGTQNILAAANDTVTYTVIAGDRNFQQGGLNYVPSVFTAPVDGVYMFSMNVEIGGNASAGNIAVRFYVNFATTPIPYLLSNFNGNSVRNTANNYCVSGSQIIKLIAGDTVEVKIQNGSATTITAFAGTFSGALLY
jgi:hypothetical protein